MWSRIHIVPNFYLSESNIHWHSVGIGFFNFEPFITLASRLDLRLAYELSILLIRQGRQDVGPCGCRGKCAKGHVSNRSVIYILVDAFSVVS